MWLASTQCTGSPENFQPALACKGCVLKRVCNASRQPRGVITNDVAELLSIGIFKATSCDNMRPGRSGSSQSAKLSLGMQGPDGAMQDLKAAAQLYIRYRHMLSNAYISLLLQGEGQARPNDGQSATFIFWSGASASFLETFFLQPQVLYTEVFSRELRLLQWPCTPESESALAEARVLAASLPRQYCEELPPRLPSWRCGRGSFGSRVQLLAICVLPRNSRLIQTSDVSDHRIDIGWNTSLRRGLPQGVSSAGV